MAVETINPDLVTISLERVEGTPFERFVNAFYPAISGVEYVPLGGLHDGGADAMFAESIKEARGPQGAFLQASVQEDHRTKIRETIRRLRKFGRSPTSVTYVTSRIIPHIDREEDLLASELAVGIRIRDRRYIAAHINSAQAAIAAFEFYLRPYLSFLNLPGNVPIIRPSDRVQSPAVYVFLRQEAERRLGKSSLLEAVADGLILWGLEETDPGKKILMSRTDLLAKIQATVPPARRFIRGVFDHRLELMASKHNPTGREVRWHKKQDLFALPYETRRLVEEKNVEDEASRADFAY